MVQVLRAALVLIVLLLAPREATAQTTVDLELVLAVDISLSMDMEEQRLQRDGYIAAFRDPEIQRVIQSGSRGRIAVTYVEWAGPQHQQVVLPWMLIDGPAAAEAFAAALERTQISRARMTSISTALEFSGHLLEANGFRGERQVIDVSGDGPNNSGRPVTQVRDELVSRGVVINGLPVLLRVGSPSGFFDIGQLDTYYENCVIGGQGAFMIPVRDKSEFGPAIRRKLMLEISSLPSQPRLIPAQAPGGHGGDCMVGEQQWRRYMDGPFRN